MRFATFISWLLTASLGAFMLRTWLVRGGLRRERARAGGLPPQLIAGHAGLALFGLVVWVAYLAVRRAGAGLDGGRRADGDRGTRTLYRDAVDAVSGAQAG